MAKNLKTGILITGDSKGAVKALEITSDEVDKLGKQAKKTSGQSKAASKSIIGDFTRMASSAAKWGAGVAAAGAAVGAALVKSGLQSVDSLAKTSDKLGVTTEALAQLRFAAEQTGVETNKFDVALQRFTRRLADAAAGSGPAVKAFDALGLSAEELVKLSPDEAFARVADQMNKVENQSQKVSLAFKLFDSEGVGLVNTLALGSEGLAQFSSEADTLGLTLSRVDAAKIEAANDSMNRISKAVSGFGQQLAIKVAPLLQVLADRMFGVAQEAGGMGNVAGKVFDFLVKAAGQVGNAVRGIEVAFNFVKIGFLTVAQFIANGWDLIFRKITAGYNKIAGIFNLDKIENAWDLTPIAEGWAEDIEEAKENIDEIMSRPLPSDSVEQFSEDVQRAYEEQAVAAVETQDIIQDAAIKTEDVTSALTTKTTKKSTAAAKEVQSAWSRVGSIFSSFFSDLVTDGENAFSNLLKGFGSMLVSMAAEAAASRILVNVGTAAAGGLASTAVSAGTSAVAGAATAGVAGAATAGVAGAGAGAAASGGLGALMTNPWVIGGVILGGIALNSIFGEKNNGNNSGKADFDLLSGSIQGRGTGKSFDQENVDSATQLAQVFSAFSEAIGGSTYSGTVRVGGDGVRLDGIDYASEAELTQAAFQEIVFASTDLSEELKRLILAFEGSTEETINFASAVKSLDNNSGFNSVAKAIEDFNNNPTASETLVRSIADVGRLIEAYDGTADSAQNLAQAFANNKQLAYDFALAIQTIGKEIATVAGEQAEYIRESILSADELRAKRTDERDSLLAVLDDITNPEELANASKRILELNREIFDSLSDEQKAAQVETFAQIAEDVNTTSQDILNESIDRLQASQEDMNERVSQMLSNAAAQQQSAADVQLEAARRQERAAKNQEKAQDDLLKVIRNLRNPGELV